MDASRPHARSRSIRRRIAGVAAAAVTAALVTVSVAPPTQAAGRPTDFAFTSFAYGTKVKAAAGELRSGRTAPSWIGCTPSQLLAAETSS